MQPPVHAGCMQTALVQPAPSRRQVHAQLPRIHTRDLPTPLIPKRPLNPVPVCPSKVSTAGCSRAPPLCAVLYGPLASTCILLEAEGPVKQPAEGAQAEITHVQGWGLLRHGRSRLRPCCAVEVPVGLALPPAALASSSELGPYAATLSLHTSGCWTAT